MLIALIVVTVMLFIYGAGEFVAQAKKAELDARYLKIEDDYYDAACLLLDKYHGLGIKPDWVY